MEDASSVVFENTVLLLWLWLLLLLLLLLLVFFLLFSISSSLLQATSMSRLSPLNSVTKGPRSGRSRRISAFLESGSSLNIWCWQLIKTGNIYFGWVKVRIFYVANNFFEYSSVFHISLQNKHEKECKIWGYLPFKLIKRHDVMNASPRPHDRCLTLAEQSLCRGKWWLPCLGAWEHFLIPGVTGD